MNTTSGSSREPPRARSVSHPGRSLVVQCSAGRSRREIQDGRSSASSKSSRCSSTGPGESGHGSSGRSRATSPTTGQSSTQVTGARKVSRPSTCQPGVPPPGRTPSSTIHQEPSGPWTRSACPVFWTGWSVPRWVRIGLAGHGSNGPRGRTAAGDRDAVAALGAALGDEQVPVVADPVQVRRLRGLGAGPAGPEPVRCAERLPGGRVDADLRDPGDRAPAGAVLVPGQVGIDAGDARRPDGIRPRSGGVRGGDDQVAAALAAVGDDQPEAAVVVAQGGGVDPAGGRHGGGQPQLVRPVQGVADLRPVHQVSAVEDGHAGEVLEAGAGQVVVVADAADAGVGVEAGDHGVGEASVRLAQRGHPIGPLVGWGCGRGVVQGAPGSVGVMRSRTADGAVGRVRLSAAASGIQAEKARLTEG